MIVLKVEDYCHNCPEFEPDVSKDEQELVEFDMMNRCEKRHVLCDTTVTCHHRYRCAAIYEHAAKQVKKED